MKIGGEGCQGSEVTGSDPCRGSERQLWSQSRMFECKISGAERLEVMWFQVGHEMSWSWSGDKEAAERRAPPLQGSHRDEGRTPSGEDTGVR